MEAKKFWGLIEAIDRDALDGGDDDAAIAPLREALTQLPASAIEAFEEELARRLYDLDGREFAEAAGESGGSDDAFLYARCFVVASGRLHYEAVLANPDMMPKSVDEWCEPLLAVASEAYEMSTGATWEFVPTTSYETGSNSSRW